MFSHFGMGTTSAILLIIFIYQIYYDFHHNILLFRPALCNHQCKGNKSIVGNTLMPVFGIKHVVVVEEPEKEHSGNAFVTVTERVVFDDEI